MIKICSLDFLNRDVFDTDVMGKDGGVIIAAGENVTPEILLNLYFKEIYIDEKFFEEEEIRAKELEKEIKAKTKEIKEKAVSLDLAESIVNVIKKEEKEPYSASAGSFSQPGGSARAPEVKAEEAVPEIKQLEFDEAKAKRVSDYAVKLANLIGMSPESIKELEQAAYHHNIGRKMFTVDDLTKPGFKKKQAAASYNILVNEMDFPEKIAEVAKDYIKRYDSGSYKLDKDFLSNVSYAHIVAIVDYYDEMLSNNASKSATLEKMLQLGGNKFNIFILHKFISMMRK